MAAAIKKNPGLKGRYDQMLADAWDTGRGYAEDRLTEYTEGDVEKGLISAKVHHALWDRKLPPENPYALEEITGFDPKRDRRPRRDVWPAAVARLLNAQLQTECQVRTGGGATGWTR